MSFAEAVENDANSLLVLIKQNLGHERMHQDVQIRSIARLAEKCFRRRATSTAANGGLRYGEAKLVRSVDIDIWIT